MQDSTLGAEFHSQPDPEPIQRLLAALGEWGVAEVEGVSKASLDLLAERAMSAYLDVAQVA